MYSGIMHKALKSNEWKRISVYKTFEIEIQNGDQIIQTFFKIYFPPETRSLLFNL